LRFYNHEQLMRARTGPYFADTVQGQPPSGFSRGRVFSLTQHGHHEFKVFVTVARLVTSHGPASFEATLSFHTGVRRRPRAPESRSALLLLVLTYPFACIIYQIHTRQKKHGFTPKIPRYFHSASMTAPSFSATSQSVAKPPSNEDACNA
jgi:hypothetical protein